MNKALSPLQLAGDPDITDQFIINQVRQGDKELYEVIIRRYNDRLYKIARSIIKDNEAEIEDIMQEAYIKAYQNLYQYRGEAKFSTWLTRILINEALATIKKKKRYQTVDIDQIDNSAVSTLTFSEESHEHQIIRDNFRQVLELAIDNLGDKYRIVFVMREIEGLSIKETATCLDITEENVKVRLHRAKQQLKKLLRTSLEGFQIYPFQDPRCNRIADNVITRISA